MSRVLIVGAGIAGCTAGLELAGQGHHVVIVERRALAGGKVLDYCCKATDECSRCGVCVAHTTVAEALAHPLIEVMTGASVTGARNSGKKVSATVTRLNPSVAYHKCTKCDACVKACPAACITKYDRGGLVQYAIDHSKCLLHHGTECRACADACSAGAIESPQSKIRNLKSKITADALLIATGHAVYDGSKKARYGYERFDEVITGEEAEKLLSAQNHLGKPNADVAFIQCVGSRDPLIGRNYCSAVCCSYAARMARVLRYRNPEGKATLYTIDLQNFDKAFTDFRRRLVDAGVSFVPGVPFSVEKLSTGKLQLKIESRDGVHTVAEHDMVVLSVGMGPAADAQEVAETFGLERDEFGFFRSSVPNVFVAGTCREPQSIAESRAGAKSAVQRMQPLLRCGPAAPGWVKKAKGDLKSVRVPLKQSVLVVGGGVAGLKTAKELTRAGYPVTLVESSGRLGGDLFAAGEKSYDLTEQAAGVEVLLNSRIVELTGSVGSFKATVETPEGRRTVEAGAVVVATGSDRAPLDGALAKSDRVIPVADLTALMSRSPRKDRPRSVAIVLDLNVEETKASTEMAFNLALFLKAKYPVEVFVFTREVRVAALDLEKLYDKAREANVNIVKFTGKLRLTPGEESVRISASDTILSERVDITCDVAAVSSYGVRASADKGLADLAGIGVDALGQLQDNNIHLFPEETNRPGVFVVGACRGQFYVPQILTDAEATALAVHRLLSQKSLDVELANAIVDADKCALCLACIRTCPHKAMFVNREKGAAESIPEACRKCGICAGECPAKAIELPLHTDAEVLGRIGTL